MNWLGCCALVLAVLKIADIVLTIKNILSIKSKAVMMMEIFDTDYCGDIRWAVNRFFENKYYFSKLIFVVQNKENKCYDYCQSYIKNLKNVELLLKEDLNEKLIDNIRNG